MRQLSLKNSTSSKKRSLSSLLCASAATFVLLQASNAYAAPTGGQVAAGDIQISTPSVGNTVIDQATDKGIINWNNFDTLYGETTRFNHNSSNAVTLNRVLDGKPTKIDGKLFANGRVMIVNANGVFFGATSQVDVAGLIASTADTSNADFLAGKVNLSIAGNKDAKIVNKGSITASDGGLVALVAPSVRNDGVIEANMGTVALASADTASVDFYGDNLYSFALDKEATSAASGVTNNGVVSVGGGKVLMTAKVAKDVVDNVINNTGIIEASSAHMEGGTVVLDGGDGNVHVSGKINASGVKGGNVTVATTGNITVAGADINASGKNGGGTVKIGGDYQGGGTLKHAKKVTVDKNSKIDVSATDSGKGGTAIVWSDELTDFNGSIKGTGGVNGGDGGFAEVSSKGELGYNGSADLHAYSGLAGTLLLDPNSLFIGNFVDHFFGTDHFVNFAPIVATLNGGTNVLVTALNNVSVLADMIWAGSGSFTINAGANAIIEAAIKSTFSGTNAQGAVTINAGTSLQMGNAHIETRSGDITVNTHNVKMSSSSMKSLSGDVTLNNTGRFGSDTANVLSGRKVTLNQSTAGFIQNAIDAVGPTGSGGALLKLGNGAWNEAINVNQGNFTIQGNGAANTLIIAPAAITDPVVSVNGVNNVRLTDLRVHGGTTGIGVNGGSLFKLINSWVTAASDVGLRVTNATNTSIIGNLFDANTTGISLTNVVGAPINNNIFQNTQNGIVVNGGNSLVIRNNDFNGVIRGVDALNSTGMTVLNNNFTGSSGIIEDESSGGPGEFAVRIVSGDHSAVNGNTIDNFIRGVIVENSTDTRVDNNTITNSVAQAILLNNNDNTFVRNNTLISGLGGIESNGSNDIDIVGNNVSDFSAGITTNTSTSLSILNNNVYNNGTGIRVLDSDNALVNNNIVSNNVIGGLILSSGGVALNNNKFTDNFVTGLGIVNSNNVVSTGDFFSGNGTYAMSVNNSQNTLIHEATMNVPVTATGLFINNGSGGTLVRGLNITGGNVGVLVDGAGSSMQFDSNTSVFTGQTKYFLLQNNAMFAGGSLAQADSLDASQQTFDGTRGADFTPAQLAAAEGITTDVEDGIPTIGNVFYKVFSAPVNTVSFFFDATNQIKEFPKAGLFSFSGRTITNNPGETPLQFDVNSLNLSLLNPSGGGAGNLANLAPAAGGNASDLAGLEPAAGGNNQKKSSTRTLASLEPAAGGGNCGNNYLDDGFNANRFDMANCDINDQQQ